MENSVADINEFAMQAKAELLFPAHLISSLRDLRGEEWRDLVEHISTLPETHPDSLAFVLMMIELDGCMKCNSNNYKFLRGCFLCATQTVQSFKGSDQELLTFYANAKQQMDLQLKRGVMPGQLSLAA